jgi:hypothetical protein
MEKSCRICAKQMLCEKEQKEVCEDYQKEPYTTIVKAEEGKYEIRRID